MTFFWRHLKRYHWKIYEDTTKYLSDIDNMKNENTSIERFLGFRNEGNGSIIESMIKFIVNNSQPFSIVKIENFQRLIQFLNPKVKLPSRVSLLKYIEEE